MRTPSIADTGCLNADGTVNITRGPALLIANGTAGPNAPDVLHSADALTLNAHAESSETVSSAIGVVGRQSHGERFELKVKPVGCWGNLAAWFPMLSMQSGDLLLPEDNNNPLDVLCITNLKVYRFARAGVIAMSNLRGGPGVDLMEEMTLGIGRRAGVGFGDPQSLMQVFDLTKARITPAYESASAVIPLAFNATAVEWTTALNTLDDVAADGGVIVAGSCRDGGLTVTWNMNGSRSGAFTATLVGFPSNTVFTQTVLTSGSADTREVRRLQVNPWMAAFTTALTPAPKQTYLISYLSEATWTPSWGGSTGPALACNVSAAELQTTLRTLCADSSLTVSGSMREGWEVTRTAGTVSHTLTATVTGAPPGTYLKVIVLMPGADAAEPMPAVSQVELLKLAPWAGFGQHKEWSLDWRAETRPVASLGLGTHNWEFAGLKVRFQVSPDAMLLEDAVNGAALQGDNTAEFGSDLTGVAQRLDINGDSICISLPKACFSRALQTQWGLNMEHIRNLTFDGVRTVKTGGTPQPFAVLESSAPS